MKLWLKSIIMAKLWPITKLWLKLFRAVHLHGIVLNYGFTYENGAHDIKVTNSSGPSSGALGKIRLREVRQ